MQGDTGDADARRRARRRRPSEAWGGIDVWVNNAAALHGQAVSRDDERGLARPAGGEPPRLLLRLPGCARQMIAQGRRADRQRHLGRRHPADRRPLGLRHREGRHPRPDEDRSPSSSARSGITVNALAPGATDTPLNQVAYTPRYARRTTSGSRSGGSRRPRRSPTRSSSSPPTRRDTSPASSSSSTAASILNGNVGHAHTRTSQRSTWQSRVEPSRTSSPAVGRERPTDDAVDDLNPGRPGRHARDGAALDGHRHRCAIAAAADAFPAWRAMSPIRRGQIFASGLADHRGASAEEIARLITREQGKTLAEARGEVPAHSVLGWIGYQGGSSPG